MNKRSVKRAPAKTSPAGHNAAPRKAASRQVPGKPDASHSVASVAVSQVTVAAVTVRGPLRSHKFRVGQTVLYTSSPISRPGANGSYKVVKLLPSDGDDYQYRIKHSGEAFERVAKESQLELEH